MRGSWPAPCCGQRSIAQPLRRHAHARDEEPTIVSQIDLPCLVTAQRWKLWLFAGLIAIAGLGFLFTDGIAKSLVVQPVMIHLGALLLTIGTLTAAFVSVRCPRCGLHLVAFAMSRQGIGQWLHWLLTVRVCPRCNLGSTGPNDRK